MIEIRAGGAELISFQPFLRFWVAGCNNCKKRGIKVSTLLEILVPCDGSSLNEAGEEFQPFLRFWENNVDASPCYPISRFNPS